MESLGGAGCEFCFATRVQRIYCVDRPHQPSSALLYEECLATIFMIEAEDVREPRGQSYGDEHLGETPGQVMIQYDK